MNVSMHTLSTSYSHVIVVCAFKGVARGGTTAVEDVVLFSATRHLLKHYGPCALYPNQRGPFVLRHKGTAVSEHEEKIERLSIKPALNLYKKNL